MLSVHWDPTGQTTLEPHWLMLSPSEQTGYQQFFLQLHPSVHWGLSSRHTGLPLDSTNYHWLRVGALSIILNGHMKSPSPTRVVVFYFNCWFSRIALHCRSAISMAGLKTRVLVSFNLTKYASTVRHYQHIVNENVLVVFRFRYISG